MKNGSLIAIIVSIFTLSFCLFGVKNNHTTLSHLNPGEEYLLSRQFNHFGEGLAEYKNAVRKELIKMKKRSGIPWQNEGPFNTGGRINCIAIHPTTSNTYLIGTADGGIFKTTNDGSTWLPIFDNATSLSVSSIEYDKNNPQIIYAGTGDQVLGGYSHMGNGIYKSVDGGNTWTNSGLNNTGTIAKIIIDPSNSNILYAGTTGNPFISDTNRGMYKSTDGGATWNHILYLGPNAGIGDVVINPTNTSILYATGRRRLRSDLQSIIVGPEARIYKTSNGGLTWDTLTNGLPNIDQCRIGLCISANNPNLLYANYVDSSLNYGGVYKTTNGGTSWTLANNPATSSISTGGFGWYFGEIRIDPNNDNTLYLLFVSIYKSTNGGTSFTQESSTHSDKHDLKFVNSTTLLMATDGGFYKSTNAGSAWTNKNNFPITQFYEVAYNPFDSTNYNGGAQDNGTNTGSLNTGANNWLKYFGGDGFKPQFNKNDDMTFYAEWQNGNVEATDNGGGGFTNITQSITSTDRCSWNSPYLVSSFNPDVLYFGSYQVYKNTNGPFDSWVPISGDLTDGTIDQFHVVTTIDQSQQNSQVIYAGTSDARAWVTQNDGANWTLINAGLSNRNVSCIVASPDNASNVFVSQTGYRNNDSLAHIYFSTNYGASWTSIAGNLPVFAVNDIWVRPNSNDSSLVIASDGGVYSTKDRGVTWERVGNNMPIIPVFDIDYNPTTKRIVAGTFARSMQTMAIDSIFPPKAQSTDGIKEIHFEISCVLYPDPATNNFSINIENAEIKKAVVYDMMGSKVKTYMPSSFNKTFDCSDLRNGYYILHLVTSKGKINKQLVIRR